MGAGRSGTTAFATFLGNNKNIQNIGEMHQFFECLDENKECSCGKLLNECEFWKNKIDNPNQEYSTDSRKLSEKMESHSSIAKHLLSLFPKKELAHYKDLHEQLLSLILAESEKSILLDSSKYIGRALALNNLNNINFEKLDKPRGGGRTMWIRLFC